MVAKNEFIKEATLRICSSLKIAEGLWETFHYIQQFMPLDEIVAYSYHVSDEVLLRIARVSAAQSRTETAVKPLKIPRFIMFLQGPETIDNIRMINDPDQDQLTIRMIRGEIKPDSSFIIMRLSLNAPQIGLLAFRTDGRGRYQDIHLKTLSLLQRPFRMALINGWRYRELEQEKEWLQADRKNFQQEIDKQGKTELIGREFGLKSVMQPIRELATENSPLLLTGEIGTGKKTLATEIHRISLHRLGPLIRFSCGSIPNSVTERELFGPDKVGHDFDTQYRPGCLERAHQGTLLLEEVSELPMATQQHLAEMLTEEAITTGQRYRSEPLDVRFIMSTRHDLAEWVAKGNFSKGLFERIKDSNVRIPSLRERVRDIPSLAHHFIRLRAKEIGLHQMPEIDPDGLERLMAYEWPGNVRELKYVVERELFLKLQRPLTFQGLGLRGGEERSAESPHEKQAVTALEQVEKAHIQQVLELAQGRIEGEGGAAELLEMHPSTLRHRLRKLKVPFGRKSKK